MLTRGDSSEVVFRADLNELEQAKREFEDLLGRALIDFRFDDPFNKTGYPQCDTPVTEFYRNRHLSLLSLYGTVLDTISNRMPFSQLEIDLLHLPQSPDVPERQYRDCCDLLANYSFKHEDELKQHDFSVFVMQQVLAIASDDGVEAAAMAMHVEILGRHENYLQVDYTQIFKKITEVIQQYRMTFALIQDVLDPLMARDFRYSAALEVVKKYLVNAGEVLEYQQREINRLLADPYPTQSIQNLELVTRQTLKIFARLFKAISEGLEHIVKHSLRHEPSKFPRHYYIAILKYFADGRKNQQRGVIRLLYALLLAVLPEQVTPTQHQEVNELSIMQVVLHHMHLLQAHLRTDFTDMLYRVVRQVILEHEVMRAKDVIEQIHSAYLAYSKAQFLTDRDRGIRLSGELESLPDTELKHAVLGKSHQGFIYPQGVTFRLMARSLNNTDLRQITYTGSYDRPIRDLIDANTNGGLCCHIRLGEVSTSFTSFTPCAALFTKLNPVFDVEHPVLSFNSALLTGDWNYTATNPVSSLPGQRRLSTVQGELQRLEMRVYDRQSKQRFLIWCVYNNVIYKIFNQQPLLVNDYRHLGLYVRDYVLDNGDVNVDRVDTPVDVLFLLLFRNRSSAETVLTTPTLFNQLFESEGLPQSVEALKQAYFDSDPSNQEIYPEFYQSLQRLGDIPSCLELLRLRYPNSAPIITVIDCIRTHQEALQRKQYEMIVETALGKTSELQAASAIGRHFLLKIPVDALISLLNDKRLRNIKDDEAFLTRCALLSHSMASHLLKKASVLSLDAYTIVARFPQLIRLANRNNALVNGTYKRFFSSANSQLDRFHGLVDYLVRSPADADSFSIFLMMDDFITVLTQRALPSQLMQIYQHADSLTQAELEKGKLWLTVHQHPTESIGEHYRDFMSKLSLTDLWNNHLRVRTKRTICSMKLHPDNVDRICDINYQILISKRDMVKFVLQKVTQDDLGEYEQGLATRCLFEHCDALKSLAAEHHESIEHPNFTRIVKIAVHTALSEQKISRELFDFAQRYFIELLVDEYLHNDAFKVFLDGNLWHKELFFAALLTHGHDVMYQEQVLAFLGNWLFTNQLSGEQSKLLELTQTRFVSDERFRQGILATATGKQRFFLAKRLADQLPSLVSWSGTISELAPSLSQAEHRLLKRDQPVLYRQSFQATKRKSHHVTNALVLREKCLFLREVVSGSRERFQQSFINDFSPSQIDNLLAFQDQSFAHLSDLRLVAAIVHGREVSLGDIYQIIESSSPELMILYLIINNIDINAVQSYLSIGESSEDILLRVIEKLYAQSRSEFISILYRFDTDIDFDLKGYAEIVFSQLIQSALESLHQRVMGSRAFHTFNPVLAESDEVDKQELALEAFLNYPRGENVARTIGGLNAANFILYLHKNRKSSELFQVLHLTSVESRRRLETTRFFWATLLQNEIDAVDVSIQERCRNICHESMNDVIARLQDYRHAEQRFSSLNEVQIGCHSQLYHFILSYLAIRARFLESTDIPVERFIAEVSSKYYQLPDLKRRLTSFNEQDDIHYQSHTVELKKRIAEVENSLAIVSELINNPHFITCYAQRLSASGNVLFIDTQKEKVIGLRFSPTELNQLALGHHGAACVWQPVFAKHQAELLERLDDPSLVCLLVSSLSHSTQLRKADNIFLQSLLNPDANPACAARLTKVIADLIENDIVTFVRVIDNLPPSLCQHILRENYPKIITRALAHGCHDIFSKQNIVSFFTSLFAQSPSKNLADTLCDLFILYGLEYVGDDLLSLVFAECDLSLLLEICLQRLLVVHAQTAWKVIYARLLNAYCEPKHEADADLLHYVLVVASHIARENQQYTLGYCLPQWMANNPELSHEPQIARLLIAVVVEDNFSSFGFLKYFAGLGDELNYVTMLPRQLVLRNPHILSSAIKTWAGCIDHVSTSTKSHRVIGNYLVDILVNEVANDQIAGQIAKMLLSDRILERLCHYLIVIGDVDITRLRNLISIGNAAINQRIIAHLVEHEDYQDRLVSYDDIAKLMLDALAPGANDQVFKQAVLVNTTCLMRNKIYADGISHFISKAHQTIPEAVLQHTLLNMPNQRRVDLLRRESQQSGSQLVERAFSFSTPNLSSEILTVMLQDIELISRCTDDNFIARIQECAMNIVMHQADLPYIIALIRELTRLIHCEQLPSRDKYARMVSTVVSVWATYADEFKSPHNRCYLLDIYLLIAALGAEYYELFTEIKSFIEADEIWPNMLAYANMPQLVQLLESDMLEVSQVLSILQMEHSAARLGGVSLNELNRIGVVERVFEAFQQANLKRFSRAFLSRSTVTTQPLTGPSASISLMALCSLSSAELQSVSYHRCKTRVILEQIMPSLKQYAGVLSSSVARLRFLNMVFNTREKAWCQALVSGDIEQEFFSVIVTESLNQPFDDTFGEIAENINQFLKIEADNSFDGIKANLFSLMLKRLIPGKQKETAEEYLRVLGMVKHLTEISYGISSKISMIAQDLIRVDNLQPLPDGQKRLYFFLSNPLYCHYTLNLQLPLLKVLFSHPEFIEVFAVPQHHNLRITLLELANNDVEKYLPFRKVIGICAQFEDMNGYPQLLQNDAITLAIEEVSATRQLHQSSSKSEGPGVLKV